MADDRRKPFPFDQFEPAWQDRWLKEKTYRTPEPGDADFDASKPKFYVLDMFPYPSGAGLHVGHPEGYTATDIIGRYKLRRGFNVLHPMGWDAFGLPAEQYAIKTGQHPRITTEANVANFRRQLQALGFAYDWDREVNTTDPEYIRWTQWIFLQLYHSYFDEEQNKARPVAELEAKGWSREQIDDVRLAYIHEAPVNWSPSMGTVLANEEIEEWKAKGETVERRPLRQWMLRITKFAQRLIDDLEPLDWPDSIKLLQRNWIGRSEGAEVSFTVVVERASSGLALASSQSASEPSAADATLPPITVFTTRPDTLFGATYMVLAPEHPLVQEITTAEQKEAVEAYIKQCASKSDLERGDLNKDKSGVFTGAHATNPVDDGKIPVWIADYVMMGYGTGAIMAVPGHDERDYEFAQKFDLPVVQVVQPGGDEDWKGFTGKGTSVNSGFLDGLPTPEAKKKIIAWLEEQGKGTGKIQYKLRDWLFSRQRYWGEPFPIVWEDGRHRALPESELPLLQPEMEDFKPTGDPRGPLVKATAWIKYSETATRETNTMPQWAGSCWYYLRYCDPGNNDRFISEEAEHYWSGTAPDGGRPGGASLPSGMVDLYVGGTEHAVLHLLYARFWHKVLHDLGHLSTNEPFQRLVNQGLILGEMEFSIFLDSDQKVVSYKEVKEEDHSFFHKRTGGQLTKKVIPAEQADKKGEHFVWVNDQAIRVRGKAEKMSKSIGNVVNPDDVVREYGADALRLYEMFMGPLEQVKPWSMKGVEGVSRFLAKVWRLAFQLNQEGEWVRSAKLIADSDPALSAEASAKEDLLKITHKTIKKVGEDIEALKFNTAISQMMECVNAFTAAEKLPESLLVTLLQVLNPFAPHLTEEVNARVAASASGGSNRPADLLSGQPWPDFNEVYLVEDEIQIVVQVNGKVRAKLTVPADAGKAHLEELAQTDPKVQQHTDGKTVRKIIVVPGKLVNIVAN